MSALNDPSLPITVTVAAYDAQASAVGMYDRGEAAPPLDGLLPRDGARGAGQTACARTCKARTWPLVLVRVEEAASSGSRP
jgi:hypothetical protein